MPVHGLDSGVAAVYLGVRPGHTPTSHAIKTALKLLKDGEKLLMFPEGTRIRNGVDKHGEAGPRPGPRMLATRTGVPLVPDVHSRRKRAGSAATTVVIGEALLSRCMQGRKPTAEELDAITDAGDGAASRALKEADR